MALLQRGDRVCVEYQDPRARPLGLHHERIVAGHVEQDEYMIITPDHDIYVEQLSGRNRDLASFHMVGPDGMLPAAVNPASV